MPKSRKVKKTAKQQVPGVAQPCWIAECQWCPVRMMGGMVDVWAAHPLQPKHLPSHPSKNTHHLSYPLTDGFHSKYEFPCAVSYESLYTREGYPSQCNGRHMAITYSDS